MTEPTWSNDGIDLYLGDCLDILPQLPAGSVDAVVTDPPYGIDLGNHSGAKETRPGLLVKSGGYNDSPEYFTSVVVPALKKAIEAVDRAAVFCVPPSMWQLPAPDAIGGIYISGAVGRNKWGWSNLIHCLFYGIAPDLNLGAKPTAIYSNASAEKNGHPTVKPIKWLTWLVELVTRKEETILDPFMGSGTTGVACVQTGRKFIGIEIDPGYFDIAVKRIQQAQLQMRLPI